MASPSLMETLLADIVERIRPEWIFFVVIGLVIWAISAFLEGDVSGGDTFRATYNRDDTPDMFDGDD